MAPLLFGGVISFTYICTMKKKILAILDKKLKDLEVKVTKACEPPLTVGIYSLDGWLAEAKLLEQLKREITEL